MNINPAQIRAIRGLITKKDREHIASQAGKSVRTIEAVLSCDRVNDEIERAVVRVASMNLAKLARVISTIEAQNILPITLEQYTTIKNSPQWANDERYQRYNDIYLRLCHRTFSELDDLWQILKSDYRDIITSAIYCCDLLCRLTGVDENAAIKFYNGSILDF